MHARVALAAAAHPAPADGGDDVGRALDRRALHVMQHAADAAELLAAAGAARTAVHERRERRTVAGRFLRAMPVHDQHAAVVRREPEHESRRDSVVGREHRTGEAAVAAARNRDRIRRCRRSRSPSTPARRPRPSAPRARRRRRGTAAASAAGRRPGGGRRRGPRSAPGRRRRARIRVRAPRRAPAPRRAARGSRAAPCRHPACADRRRPSPRASPAAPRRPRRARRRGTIALRIAVHFWPALTVISRATSCTNSVELGRSRACIRPEDRGIQRIRFGDEAHGMAHDGRVRAQLRRGRRRARERDDVLAAEVVEQVADAAADQLQCTRAAGGRSRRCAARRVRSGSWSRSPASRSPARRRAARARASRACPRPGS